MEAAAAAAAEGASPLTPAPKTATDAGTDEDIEALTAEVAALRLRLAEIERERARVRRRRARAAAEGRELACWKAAWWGRVNAQAAALAAARAGLEAAAREVARRRERLRTLARTHVLDDAFFIWHAGPFATVNGLRLGRLPAVGNAPWSEVNAALGLAALLLTVLAERSGCRFRHHQLLPMGSFAKVAPASAPAPAPGGTPAPVPPAFSLSTSSSSSLSSAAAATAAATATSTPGGATTAAAASSTSASINLFYEDGFAFFRRQGFNRALQAFLRCIFELGEFAEERDPALRLPYRITQEGGGEGGQLLVGGLPIVLAPGGEEVWTRALKYALTDVKWLVAWGAKHT